MARSDGKGGRRAPALAGEPWETRRRALRRLFEEISPRYDRLNAWLSLGLDRRWRTWASRSLRGAPEGWILDLASGTGALAEALATDRLRPILRTDLSPVLLRLAARRCQGSSLAVVCEMDRLPLRAGSIAAVAQGFALRHCRELRGFFQEVYRVLAPGGRVALLDMRVPGGGGWERLYRFYYLRLLPRLAALLGGEREAYAMMVESVRALPPEPVLLEMLERVGFGEVSSRRGTLGAVRLLVAQKPSPGRPGT